MNNMANMQENNSAGMAGLCWVMTLAYMILIYNLSSRSNITLPEITNIDKLMHVLAYVPLSFLFYISFVKSGLNRYVFLAAFVCASMYGISDEIHQYFVPGRDASFSDVLADSLGAFIGALTARYLRIKMLLI